MSTVPTTVPYVVIPRHETTAVTPQKVAFVGLGVMGGSMAAHLALAGHDVTVYNRNPAKSAQWQSQFGGQTATTPQQAAINADVVMVCVGNDNDVREVVLGQTGVLAGLKAGACVVDHTTTSKSLALELAQAAQMVGVGFVDAPVSGGEIGAQKGILTIMCGGESHHFDQVQPLLTCYARAVTLLGSVGQGQLAKMVNQICIAGVLQGLAEALAFGQKAGLPMSQVLEVIAQGGAQSWQMQHRGNTMLQDEFDFGFAVDWMRKDLGLVLQEARPLGAELPLTALVDQFYAGVQAMGGGRWDTSSLIKRLR